MDNIVLEIKSTQEVAMLKTTEKAKKLTTSY